jgi:hypothetical protein
MQGTIQEKHGSFTLTRIGFADSRFALAFMIPCAVLLLYLAFRVGVGISASPARPLVFISLYLAAFLVYYNLGVWIHEKLHCLAFRGTVQEDQAKITYVRKFGVILTGYYRVTGAMTYPIMRKALLGPSVLVPGMLAIGLLGSIFLPAWWLPLLTSMAVLALMDMLHDLYMLKQIRLIGERGKYWDTGKYLEVLWKE